MWDKTEIILGCAEKNIKNASVHFSTYHNPSDAIGTATPVSIGKNVMKVLTKYFQQRTGVGVRESSC